VFYEENCVFYEENCVLKRTVCPVKKNKSKPCSVISCFTSLGSLVCLGISCVFS